MKIQTQFIRPAIICLFFLCIMHLQSNACPTNVTAVVIKGCSTAKVKISWQSGLPTLTITLNGNTQTSSTIGTGSVTFSNISPGTYSYSVKDFFNCTVFGNVTVSSTDIYALPAAATGPAKSICNGSSTTLGATSVSGSTYFWSCVPGSFTSTLVNPTVSPGASSTYTLTETNSNGCTKSNTVTVTVNPLPTPNVGFPSTVNCGGSCVLIGSSAHSGSTYSWVSTPAGFTSTNASASVCPTITSTYTLTETNSNGCSNSNTVKVTVNSNAVANAGSSSAICIGACAPIGGTSVFGSTYLWSSVPVGYTSTTSSGTVCPTNTTTYTMKETNSSGCSKTNSVKVTVNPLPTASLTPRTICSGNTSGGIGATAVAGHTYLWSPSTGLSSTTLSNPTATLTATTTYILVETNTATGCSATNTVVVTVNPLPAACVGSPITVCSGLCATMGCAAVNGSTYTWTIFGTNGDGFNNLSSTTASSITICGTQCVTPFTTTYTLTETNSNGCIKSNNITVLVNPQPLANPGNPATICSGSCATIGSSGVSGSTYTWFTTPAGANISSTTSSNPTACPTSTTTYTVVETNSNNCSKANAVIVTVVTSGCGGKLIKLNKDYNLNIYPNPFSGIVNIDFINSNGLPSTIDVISLDGRVLQTYNLGFVGNNMRHHVEFDGAKYPVGIYFVRVFNGDEIQYKKIELIK